MSNNLNQKLMYLLYYWSKRVFIIGQREPEYFEKNL